MSNNKWFSVYLDGEYLYSLAECSAGCALELAVNEVESSYLAGQVDITEGDAEKVLASYYVG